MKEPMINRVRYSEAATSDLKNRLADWVYKGPLADEWYDDDFRRRYAAILLRERGL